MKVAYVGNFGVSFSTESHVALALESLGHHVNRLQENDVDWRYLPIHAEAGGYDFVLWTHTHGYADESKHDDCQYMINECRRRSIPTVSYHLDKWWGLERQAQAETEPFFRTDLCITADGGHDQEWASVGVNHFWMPPAVNHEEVYRATPRNGRTKRVGFVGNWQQYGHAEAWPWRFELVSNVWRRYGAQFRSLPRNGHVRGADLNQAYAEMKVVVGDSCLANGAHHYWSDRVPETIGRGGFLLHPRVAGLDDHYPTDLLPIRFDVGELAQVYELIDYWSDPARDVARDEMIEASMQHAVGHHTYRVRMAAVCDMIDDYR